MHDGKIQMIISIMYLANYLYIFMKSMYHNYTFHYNGLLQQPIEHIAFLSLHIHDFCNQSYIFPTLITSNLLFLHFSGIKSNFESIL